MYEEGEWIPLNEGACITDPVSPRQFADRHNVDGLVMARNGCAVEVGVYSSIPDEFDTGWESVEGTIEVSGAFIVEDSVRAIRHENANSDYVQFSNWREIDVKSS